MVTKKKRWKARKNLDKAVDIESALDAVGGHHEILVEMIRIFMADYPQRMESLRRSIEKADSDGVRSCAHGIRGNLVQVMAYNASELAERIEMTGKMSRMSEAEKLMSDFEEEMERVVWSLREFVESRQSAGRS